MKAKEIKRGGLYRAAVNGRLTTVRVDAIEDNPYGTPGHRRVHTAYYVTNLATGRRTTFRSAQKFKGPAGAAGQAGPAVGDRVRVTSGGRLYKGAAATVIRAGGTLIGVRYDDGVTHDVLSYDVRPAGPGGGAGRPFEHPAAVPVPFALAVWAILHEAGTRADRAAAWEELDKHPRAVALGWIRDVLIANRAARLEAEMAWFGRELTGPDN
jgi:hypothetical protein